MPDETMNAWVKDVFGVDPATYEGPGGSAPQGAGAARQSFAGDVVDGVKAVGGAVGGAVVGGAKALGHGVVAVGEGVAGVATTIGKGVVSGVKAVGGAIDAKAMSIADGDYEKSMKRLDTAVKSVKDAGLDATPYEAQAKNIRDAHAEALKQGDLSSRYKAVSACSARAKTAADEAVVDVEKLKKSAVEGVTAAIKSMRDEAKAQIDKVGKDDPKKAGLVKSLGELDKSIEEVGKLTDRAERAKKLKDVNTAAQALFDKAIDITKDAAKIQEVYAKALKERYGIEIKNPAGMPNTHLDQVYKMFDRVPEADVAQNKMKQLTYEPTAMVDDGHGGLTPKKNKGASYGGASINMGDYAKEDWPYVDPSDPTGKTPMKANGFSISTLHELGHSVDDRFKIMDNNQSKSGGGGWQKESQASTAKMFVTQFKSGDGKKLSKPLDDRALATAVNGALGGQVNRPNGMTDPDWAKLKVTLDICFSRRAGSAAWPWSAKSAHDINGRTYHEAYSGEWYSYETAIRAKALTVRDYQWRAPGEWFAELYAFSFYNKKKPPSGVDSALVAYMFGGSAADKSEPKKGA